MKILECSSKGDKRFSAMYAKVNLDGVIDTIENHYQLSKRFGDFVPKTQKDAKGKRPSHFMFRGKKLPIEKLTDFYNFLWKLYLTDNPELVNVLLKYDDFKDSFARPGCNNQAEAIKTFLRNRR